MVFSKFVVVAKFQRSWISMIPVHIRSQEKSSNLIFKVISKSWHIFTTRLICIQAITSWIFFGASDLFIFFLIMFSLTSFWYYKGNTFFNILSKIFPIQFKILHQNKELIKRKHIHNNIMHISVENNKTIVKTEKNVLQIELILII